MKTNTGESGEGVCGAERMDLVTLDFIMTEMRKEFPVVDVFALGMTVLHENRQLPAGTHVSVLFKRVRESLQGRFARPPSVGEEKIPFEDTGLAAPP